jgi:hypothetical protein
LEWHRVKALSQQTVIRILLLAVVFDALAYAILPLECAGISIALISLAIITASIVNS